MVKHRKPDPELLDEENPEWTVEDFRRAKTAAEVLPELFGKRNSDAMLRPKRGRPASASPKSHINIRLDADVVEAFRASGEGWQTRINTVLKNWLKTHSRA